MMCSCGFLGKVGGLLRQSLFSVYGGVAEVAVAVGGIF